MVESIIIVSTLVTIISFYLIQRLSNNVLRIMLKIRLLITLNISLVFAFEFDYIANVLGLIIFLVLIELIYLKIKSRQLKSLVNEDIVKHHIINILNKDSESLEVIAQRINGKTYVIPVLGENSRTNEELHH